MPSLAKCRTACLFSAHRRYENWRRRWNNKAKLEALKTTYDSDINVILTPDQQKKLIASKAATLEKMKAAKAAKAAASASPSPSPAKKP
jgi:hypothetical protein